MMYQQLVQYQFHVLENHEEIFPLSLTIQFRGDAVAQ